MGVWFLDIFFPTDFKHFFLHFLPHILLVLVFFCFCFSSLNGLETYIFLSPFIRIFLFSFHRSIYHLPSTIYHTHTHPHTHTHTHTHTFIYYYHRPSFLYPHHPRANDFALYDIFLLHAVLIATSHANFLFLSN